jgi:acyl-CoA thioesterase FadM
MQRITSTASTTSSSSVEEQNESKTSFTSPIIKVYIEDTDAYGVMYNANYLRSYERALATSTCILDDHDDDWSVVHLKQQKFKSSASLGGHYVIKGYQHEENQNTWDLIMACPSSENIIYNTATLTVGSGSIGWNLSRNQTETPYGGGAAAIMLNGSFNNTHYDTLHRDEFDPHNANHLPLRSVLNLCERARSNVIGGPNALRKLQEEDNILVVVTAIKDCFSVKHHSYPRQAVQVITEIIPKRRLACDCRHVLLDNEGNVMAKAVVTLMSLNATTKRPTYKEGLWSSGNNN